MSDVLFSNYFEDLSIYNILKSDCGRPHRPSTLEEWTVGRAQRNCRPRARRTPGYGLEARGAIDISIQAETERSDFSACLV